MAFLETNGGVCVCGWVRVGGFGGLVGLQNDCIAKLSNKTSHFNEKTEVEFRD